MVRKSGSSSQVCDAPKNTDKVRGKTNKGYVRRSARIRRAFVQTLNSNNEPDWVEIRSGSETEEDELQNDTGMELPVVEPAVENAHDKETEHPQNTQQETLDMKVDNAIDKLKDLTKIIDLLVTKVDMRNDSTVDPFNFRSMYMESQLQAESLKKENIQLIGKLENAIGKIEVFEKDNRLDKSGGKPTKAIVPACKRKRI